MLTIDEISRLLGVSTRTVKIWRDHGLLRATPFSDKNECLYEPPRNEPPARMQGRKLAERRRFPEVVPNRTKEVQCEC